MDPWRHKIIETYDRHRGGIARLEGDRNLSLDYCHSLIVPSSNAETTDNPPCPNSSPDREPCWQEPPWLERERFLPYSFLLLVAKVCTEAKVIDCGRQACQSMRQKMRESAPECRWESFREWALQAVACQRNFTLDQRLSMAHTHLVNCAFACYRLAKALPSQPPSYLWVPPQAVYGKHEPGTILMEVCNIIFWMLNIQVEMGLSPTNYTGWGPRFLPEATTLPVVRKAEEDLDRMDICKTQIWNLIGTSERKECDLPDIMTALKVHSSIRHLNHNNCTPATCVVQRLSSTHLKQLCKCSSEGSCEQLAIVVTPLSTAVRSGTPTAWLLDGTRLVSHSEPYLALSHVWSDGTGDGTKQQGIVNSCLFEYFAKISASLECTGIWWDTLSLPKDKGVRNEALRVMHNNYGRAKSTVVHDNFLLNQEFESSEKACLALVLSPWFTRGWTALELAVSKNVKVLFKGSTSKDPDIRDLNTEILASGPETASRAHWLATCAIKRITQIDNLNEVITILSQRYTSWEEDRVKIASLLAGILKPDFSGTSMEITQRLIYHFGRVSYSVVLHDRPTMTESGGFSWCPPRVDEMPIDVRRDLDLDDDEEGDLIVGPDGSVTGVWLARPVSILDMIEKRLSPESKDPIVIHKVQTALESWGHCLILYQDVQLDRRALLVKTIEVNSHEGVIDCQYVGVIVDTKAEPKYDNSGIENWLDAVMPDGEKELGNRYCPFPIRLGKSFSITVEAGSKQEVDEDDDDSHAWKILNEAQKVGL